MKNQENMIPPKGQNNLPITDPKNMAMQDLPNKKFRKMAILGKLRELQENTKTIRRNQGNNP